MADYSCVDMCTVVSMSHHIISDNIALVNQGQMKLLGSDLESITPTSTTSPHEYRDLQPQLS